MEDMWRCEGTGTVTCYVTKFALNTAVSYVNGTVTMRSITKYINTGVHARDRIFMY